MISTPTREQALDLYYFLRLNRSLEELLARLFRQDKINGGLFGSRGQEAISVGAAYALGPDDWMAPMIRNIGALLVRGFRPRDVLTQHMGRIASPTQGKDGTSHFGDLSKRHVIAPISMLGDLIPVMTGAAMAGRYLGQKIVAMTWIGDGGSSTGAFHEGLNFAAVQKAPLVLVIENNQWAYSTPVSRQAAIRDLAGRARAYGMEGVVIDGNDVLEVWGAAREAVERAREGGGPVLIEAKTMRMTVTRSTIPPSMCRAKCSSTGRRAIRWSATRNISAKIACGMRKQRRSWTRASSASWPRIWRLRKLPLFRRPSLPNKASIATAAIRPGCGLAASERGRHSAQIERHCGLDGQGFW